MTTPSEPPSTKPSPEQNPVQRLTEAIAKGRVHMRPKWKLVLEHSALAAAIALVAIGLVYFWTFLTYLWRRGEYFEVSSLGREGYGIFLRVFPWWHLLFVLLGAIALIFVVRRHTHLYRWPLAAIVGVFLFAFLLAAGITDSTHLHDRLANNAYDQGSIPFVGPFYRGQRPITEGLVTPGEITKVKGSTLTVSVDDATLTVKITDDTHLPPGWHPAVGDEIVVIGKRSGHTITALDIRTADDVPDRPAFHPRGERRLPPPSYY